MSASALDRDYATAWPLVDAVLVEASNAPQRRKARMAFFETVRIVVLRRRPVSPKQRRLRQALAREASKLHALDAFAVARRLHGPHDLPTIHSLQKRTVFMGPLLRFLLQVETWDSCRTPRERGEQGLITILLIRDDPPVAAQVSEHLLQRATAAEGRGELVSAFRFRLGAEMCQRDVTRRDVTRLIAPVAAKNPEQAAREQPAALAASRAEPKSYAYVVHLNRLSTKPEKPYLCRHFRSRTELADFVQKNVQFIRKNGPPLRPHAVGFHIGVDRVGVEVGSKVPAVCSFRRTRPYSIGRDSGAKNAWEWHADLQACLARDLMNQCPTLLDLVHWHKSEVVAEDWLFGSRPGKGNPTSLFQRIQAWAKSTNTHTAASLIAGLEQFLADARRLRRAAKYYPYRQLVGWCRAVTRKVLAGEGPDIWIMRPPRKAEATASSPLTFNSAYNFALIENRGETGS